RRTRRGRRVVSRTFFQEERRLPRALGQTGQGEALAEVVRPADSRAHTFRQGIVPKRSGTAHCIEPLEACPAIQHRAARKRALLGDGRATVALSRLNSRNLAVFVY